MALSASTSASSHFGESLAMLQRIADGVAPAPAARAQIQPQATPARQPAGAQAAATERAPIAGGDSPIVNAEDAKKAKKAAKASPCPAVSISKNAGRQPGRRAPGRSNG